MTAVQLRRIVIFGASGFIGRRLKEILARRDEVSVIGHSSATCDLLSPEAARRALSGTPAGTTVVVCAGIGRAIEDSPATLRRNIAIAENVRLAADEQPIRSLIFLSSVDVYGRPPREIPVDETSPLAPSSHYGVSKVASELLLGLLPYPVTILRLPGVYGPGDGGASVVGLIVRRLLANDPIAITGDGRTLRDYMHVDDVCATIEACVDAPHTAVYNIVSGRSVAISDIVEYASRSTGKPATIQRRPKAPTGGDLCFDARRIRDAFPEIAFRDIERGIDDYIDALSAHASD